MSAVAAPLTNSDHPVAISGAASRPVTPAPRSARAETAGTGGAVPRLVIAMGRNARVSARLEPIVGDGVTVTRIDVDLHDTRDGGEAVAGTDGEVMTAAVEMGVAAGVPIVFVIGAWGGDTTDGVAGLAAWGRVARALTAASGRVPLVAIIDGPCLGSAALLVGLVDVVIATTTARMHLHDPDSIMAITGVTVDPETFGNSEMHLATTGVAHLGAVDSEDALDVVADLLDLLPPNNESLPSRRPSTDPAMRRCIAAEATVPRDGRRSYDVRAVLTDVVDHGDLLELSRAYAPAVVTALARIDGHPVGLVANQPCALAGALDIESSQKAARFVRLCDSMNLPIVTFVDTPGFRPGRDQEWRGMIRHGAQLAFAYAEATVPRICVIVRKAYGGAFIVMDCKTMGNDLCVAWPSAEIAVMGATGAVQVVHRRHLASLPDTERTARTEELLGEYEATFLTPRLALERGYVDEVIDPIRTRAVIAGGLAALGAKHEMLRPRRHSNSPQ